jgi:hypothetical protein
VEVPNLDMQERPAVLRQSGIAQLGGQIVDKVEALNEAVCKIQFRFVRHQKISSVQSSGAAGNDWEATALKPLCFGGQLVNVAHERIGNRLINAAILNIVAGIVSEPVKAIGKSIDTLLTERRAQSEADPAKGATSGVVIHFSQSFRSLADI